MDRQGNSNEASNKRNSMKARGFDAMHRSSSVNSKSSSTRGSRCHVCDEEEIKITKPFVRCLSCKAAWHLFCHTPKIPQHTLNFTCNKCTKRKGAASTSSSATPRVSPDTVIDRRYHVARPSVAKKTATVRRPIKKNKIYHISSEDGKLLNNTKRKRSSPDPNVSNSSNHLVTSTQPNLPRSIRDVEMRDTLPDKITSKPPRQAMEVFDPLASAANSTRLSNKDTPITFQSSHRVAIPPISNKNLATAKKTALPPDLLRMMNPESTIDESPEYEPPPPKPLSPVMNPWASENHIRIVRTNVTHNPFTTGGLPAMLNQPLANARGYKSPYVSIDTEKDATPPSVGVHENTPTLDATEDQHTDEYIPDMQPLAITETLNEQAPPKRHSDQSTLMPQPAITITPGANSRAMESLPNTKISPNVSDSATTQTSKVNSPSILVSSTDNRVAEPVPHPMSLEAKRLARARDFDSSELDSWLNKQQPKTDYPRSPKELLASQIWGNIDPRVVWSEERSPEWLAAKRAEIEARPKRKANFGKLLTEQIKDDRRAKGWSVHQEKEIVNDDQTVEMNKRLEELTGIKVIGAVPELGIRNGHLFMVEATGND
ncbi:uncharacterized protein BP5553_05276 [Venustampulla echinocandica]|uniref:Zinc finger PHD-type domain-containing protein n=1 Tax=Venustampulla echinocandica TaxID=2656787 RepID=A0A370TQP5_9HELO|nr:uncharacterized protein BP5553_05276 [Venustampulla echinocandica]RDL37843.1 hypothetical protein BP5553_05276 [Venustampulla echinocandica]